MYNKNTITNNVVKDLSDISNLHNILIKFCKGIEQTEDIPSILSMLECINDKTENLYLHTINPKNK